MIGSARLDRRCAVSASGLEVPPPGTVTASPVATASASPHSAWVALIGATWIASPRSSSNSPGIVSPQSDARVTASVLSPPRPWNSASPMILPRTSCWWFFAPGERSSSNRLPYIMASSLPSIRLDTMEKSKWTPAGGGSLDVRPNRKSPGCWRSPGGGRSGRSGSRRWWRAGAHDGRTARPGRW